MPKIQQYCIGKRHNVVTVDFSCMAGNIADPTVFFAVFWLLVALRHVYVYVEVMGMV